MAAFDMPNWEQVFAPDLSLLESFLRASLVYLALIVLFRIILKRQAGSLGLPDIMLVVLVSECVSSSLSAEANSVPNGLAAVFGLLFWNYLLDRLACRWPWLQRRLEPQPLELVRDGKPIRENMKAEGISDSELSAQLRLNGVEGVAEVKVATIESEGAISVVPKGESPSSDPPVEKEEQKPADGPPDFEGVARRFRAVAEELQKAVAWHDGKAAEHSAAAKDARELLAQHGIRLGRPPVPKRARNAVAPQTALT